MKKYILSLFLSCAYFSTPFTAYAAGDGLLIEFIHAFLDISDVQLLNLVVQNYINEWSEKKLAQKKIYIKTFEDEEEFEVLKTKTLLFMHPCRTKIEEEKLTRRKVSQKVKSLFDILCKNYEYRNEIFKEFERIVEAADQGAKRNHKDEKFKSKSEKKENKIYEKK